MSLFNKPEMIIIRVKIILMIYFFINVLHRYHSLLLTLRTSYHRSHFAFDEVLNGCLNLHFDFIFHIYILFITCVSLLGCIICVVFILIVCGLWVQRYTSGTAAFGLSITAHRKFVPFSIRLLTDSSSPRIHSKSVVSRV